MDKPENRAAQVRVGGPLAPCAASYKAKLEESGYTARSVANKLGKLSRFSLWLEGQGVELKGLDRQKVAPFVAVRRRGAATKAYAPRSLSLALLLDAMRETGVLNEEPAGPEASAAEAVLARFQRHLEGEREVKAETAGTYVSRARRFLVGQALNGELCSLQARDVTAAVLEESARASAASVRTFVASLRAFLRFCFLEGLLGADLSEAALAVGGGRRRSALPRGVACGDADALLKSCDRRTAIGRRDYAVILLLLRLGLRAGEVAAMRLEDIDWRSGEVVVRGKGSRLDRLPLPGEVGRAIAAYLARGRPRCPCREVFLRAAAPLEGLSRTGISLVVHRACARAGLEPFGAHRLRHNLACQMVAAGVPVPAIGAVLRHRSVTSTANYARVDVERLREVALPWPSGAL